MTTIQSTLKSTSPSTCERPRAEAAVHAHANATEALHRIKELALHDPSFAAALRASDSPQIAADQAHRRGIDISAAALWRNRGTLAPGGMPTWRG